MIKNRANYLTSFEAAEVLGFTPDHVRKLIARGKIKAEKLGHIWIIHKKSLHKVRRQRFPIAIMETLTNGSA
jgi:excisionase family DNA binding protein